MTVLLWIAGIVLALLAGFGLLIGAIEVVWWWVQRGTTNEDPPTKD